MCGLVRILLISCVIASQLFARCGGGSRARADSLRTSEVRGSDMVSMRCLLQLAPNARRAAHAQISMVDRMDVVVHLAAQGRHEPTSHR